MATNNNGNGVRMPKWQWGLLVISVIWATGMTVRLEQVHAVTYELKEQFREAKVEKRLTSVEKDVEHIIEGY